MKNILTENMRRFKTKNLNESLIMEQTPLKVKIIGGGKNKDAWYQDYIGKIFTVYKGNETLAKSFGYEFFYEVLKWMI